MDITDRDRTELHNKLGAILGEKDADRLMAHLPPVTWQDVATKNDVRVLGIELRAEMERGLARQTRWLLGAMIAWSSVLVATAALIF